MERVAKIEGVGVLRADGSGVDVRLTVEISDGTSSEVQTWTARAWRGRRGVLVSRFEDQSCGIRFSGGGSTIQELNWSKNLVDGLRYVILAVTAEGQVETLEVVL